MAHHELALHAIMKGADMIPDKVWNLIPGHKEKKPHGKDGASNKEEKSELTSRRHRLSETSGHRSSREYDISDESDHDRRRRPRRATIDSRYSSQAVDDLDYYHDRGRRSRTFDDKYGADHDYRRRSGGSSNRPPLSYAHGAGSPNPLFPPTSYTTGPYGQPVPFAYMAVPPVPAQAPPYQPGYSTTPSAVSSRSMSNPPAMRSNVTSRRSSVYSNNNYSPMNNHSPHMRPYAQTPPQAYQTHPAYTNGEPPSTAARRYTPPTQPQDQAIADLSATAPASQLPPPYARPSPSTCPTCGCSPAPSPLQLPHPQPTHTLSFPFLHSNASFARNLHSYSPPPQPSSTSLHRISTTPAHVGLSRPTPSSTGGPAPTVPGRRHSVATSGQRPASARHDASSYVSNVSHSILGRSNSVTAQIGRRSSLGPHQQRRQSTTLNKVTEKLEDAAGAATDGNDRTNE